MFKTGVLADWNHWSRNAGVTFNKERNSIMKCMILSIVCSLAAPLAFAPQSTTTTETTVAKPTITTSETTTTTTYTDGTVTSYEPGKTIIVRKEGVTDPI